MQALNNVMISGDDLIDINVVKYKSPHIKMQQSLFKSTKPQPGANQKLILTNTGPIKSSTMPASTVNAHKTKLVFQPVSTHVDET